MELFNQLARSDELRQDHMLQPGEIELLSNHTQLHTRAAFEDYDDVDQRRHLLRLWLAPAVDRPLPESYKEIYGGSVEVRARGRHACAPPARSCASRRACALLRASCVPNRLVSSSAWSWPPSCLLSDV
jgi:hypothetical protein